MSVVESSSRFRVALWLLGILFFLMAVPGCYSPDAKNEGGSIRAETPLGKRIAVTQSDNPKTGASFRALETPGGFLMEASTGETFENKNATTEAVFSAFAPYHWAAIACAIVGAVILGTGYLPNRWGIALIACAGALALAGHLLPAYGHLLPWVGALAALLGIGYWLYHHGREMPLTGWPQGVDSKYAKNEKKGIQP